jgi:hypothetical protein
MNTVLDKGHGSEIEGAYQIVHRRGAGRQHVPRNRSWI